MFTVILLVLIVGMAIAIAVRLIAPRGRMERSDIGVTNRDADDFPGLGEPSARQPGGQPVPGSRANRHRHGKP